MLDLRIIGQDPPARYLGQNPLAESGTTWTLWASGFRPFFSGAGLLAPFPILIWLATLLGHFQWRSALPAVFWHSHEMVFGFSASVIAGFLLTAVPNWTSIPTPKGKWLIALFSLWLLARLAILTSDPAWLNFAAVLDLLFLPALAVAIGQPLVAAKKWHNLVFLPILGCLTFCNACSWAGMLGWTKDVTFWTNLGREGGIGLVLLLISIIGGRVIPFFTERALPDYQAARKGLIHDLASVFVLLACFASLVPPQMALPIWVGAAVLQSLRLVAWNDRRIWQSSQSLLWILYVGYAFLPLGFALKALASQGVGTFSLALHCHTAGCIGIMILGMMARVALGHSGRELRVARPIQVAFILLPLSAISRTLLPLIQPHYYSSWLWVAAGLWTFSFGLFTLIYLPILSRPRADGKPG